MIFYTSATEHLAGKVEGRVGKCRFERFSDGEVFVRVEEEVRQKEVWVIGSTVPPAENLLELFFLLDTLVRGGAEVNLLVTYFGYARQDRVIEGEAFSSKIVCDWLKGFHLSRILVLHMHSPRIRDYLSYEELVPVELFLPIIADKDVFLAPDKGAVPLVRDLSRKCGRRAAIMEKVRPEKEEVKMASISDGFDKKRVVIVDDMISTGKTIIEASVKLEEAGAKEIWVVATHGIFSKDALERIEKSAIKKVFVTDSIHQTRSSEKVRTLEIWPLIRRIIEKSA